MSTAFLASSQDNALAEVFGMPVNDLQAHVIAGHGTISQRRAVELHRMLALSEEQVRRVRQRVHQTTAPDTDLDTLTADQLAFDAQWLDAALSARSGYLTALATLLRTMPANESAHRLSRFTQMHATARMPAPAETNAAPRASRT